MVLAAVLYALYLDRIVVKQFDAAQGGLGLFTGATILADGAPALIMGLGSLL